MFGVREAGCRLESIGGIQYSENGIAVGMVRTSRFLVGGKQELAVDNRVGQSPQTLVQVFLNFVFPFRIWRFTVSFVFPKGSLFGSSDAVLPASVCRGAGSTGEMGSQPTERRVQVYSGECLGHLEIRQSRRNGITAKLGPTTVLSSLS